MLTFDRYLLRLFLKVLLVCFVSFTGLYIVIDGFSNLDEFLDYGRRQGGTLAVVAGYYSPRVPWLFDGLSGLLVLIAAMFAVTWLQRTNELTALMAAGIPKSRVVKPLIAAAIVVAVAAAVNREVVIPLVRHKLTRNAQDWLGENARPVQPVTDNKTDILINGRYTYAREQRIESPHFRLHRHLGGFGRQLVANSAYYRPPERGRPGGYLLDEVQQPEGLTEIPSARINGEPIILSPHDTRWLKQDQCFVVSAVDFDQLSAGSLWRRFSSTGQLMAGLRNPSLAFGLDARVTIHARMVQPFLDLTLLFLGLPLVLTRDSRNIFVAVGWCLLVVIVFYLVVMFCQGLGMNGYLLSPALAAWCPLIIFAPLATALAHPIWE